MGTQLSTDFADRIREATGENVYLCYHCVKCTSGCPLAEYFDLAPNQVMRAAQLGMEEAIFESRSPWLCASCQTCTTRCPQGIDIARVMDFIVSEAMSSGVEPKVPEVALFNRVFLRDVDILGRAYELGLIAEMNVRTGQPFKDLGLGLEMFKHRKINLLPEVVRRRRRKTPMAPASRPANEVGYYPGCSLHSMAKEFDTSTRSVLKNLGLKPVEPEGWLCCGSSPAHRVDHRLSVQLPLESLVLVEQEGLGEVVLPCAMCFNRFRAAAYELRLDPELKESFDHELGYEYNDSVKISSMLDLIEARVGLEAVKASVERPLTDLKVACYYGCLLTRPPKVTGSTEAEYPMAMDRLIEALGGTPVAWDYKVACCGASLSLTQTDIVLKLSRSILANAQARGADVIAVACPMCHANLDGRQTQMQNIQPIPTLYFTQLMAVAQGHPEQAALERTMVDARPVLSQRGLI
ncbi:MAG TPA: heterodisulfide reductase-related iron-sulfur binding cluster [Anaerolineales bacterium]|nr:heterodisulfide reductase-related iron-sulfur binding cluster [Anaerolineales bacterium]